MFTYTVHITTQQQHRKLSDVICIALSSFSTVMGKLKLWQQYPLLYSVKMSVAEKYLSAVR